MREAKTAGMWARAILAIAVLGALLLGCTRDAHAAEPLHSTAGPRANLRQDIRGVLRAGPSPDGDAPVGGAPQRPRDRAPPNLRDFTLGALTFGGRALWLLFLSALLYLLPGGAAVAWLLHGGSWVERWFVALVLGAGINALLVYATMAGLRLGPVLVGAYLALCAALIAIRWRRGSLEAFRTGVRAACRDPFYWTLGGICLLVVGVRVWVIRDLVAPRWGDSVQHTVITQLTIDHGGLFDSWMPYAPYVGLNTHFGFHANAALFHWVSGIGAVQSVIWVGQVFNVMAALALYPLGTRIGGRWGGALAVMVGGLWAGIPMMYVNWGRYPQLAGQALLPIAAWLLWRALDAERWDWPALALAGLGAAAQFLAYYRMPYYYAALVGSLLLCVWAPRLGLRWRRWGALLLKMVLVGAIAGLVLAPWLLHIARGQLASLVVQGVSAGQGDRSWLRAEYEQWRHLGFYIVRPLLLLAGAAFLWAAARRAGPALSAGLWAAGLFSLVATRLIGLPGASHLNTFASMILMYAPVSILVGWLGSRGMALLERGGRRWGRWGGAIAVTLLALWGATRVRGVSDASFDMVGPADLEAMDWIREHTPPDARFLVNGFTIWDGRSAVGSDAGWWIPLLAGRENTMPPQYALLSEEEMEPGYGLRIVDLVAGLRETPLSTAAGLRKACDEGVTHVYVGQGDGRVGVPPPEPLFTAEEMGASPAFEALYHQDGAWVFALLDGACQAGGEE